MPPELPSTPLQWGILGTCIAIIVWVVYALLRGTLVPRRTMDERLKDWEARLAQSQENSHFWKQAAEAYQRANSEMIPMLKKGLDNDETLLKAFLSWKEVGGTSGN